MSSDLSEFCLQIETYLCKKNDGHLIRVTGPSFAVVSSWASQGIPLKVAYAGIDRYFERYYRKGPRRRPVKIDFCDADVLDAFDEWRRALGAAPPSEQPAKGSSLPAHLERVVMRLSSARATGKLGETFDGLIDRISVELDVSRADARGLRGQARQELIGRLAGLDAELVAAAKDSLDESAIAELTGEAATELASFRERMAPEAFARAREGALARLIRERFNLPVVAFM